jgi:cytochrome c556
MAVRKKISEAIEEYKVEESKYEEEMKTLQTEVDADQAQIKYEMEHGETGKKVAM